MLGTMMDVPLTLPLLLDRAADLFGSREIVSRRLDRSLVRSSYRELHERSYALARALVRAGLRPGERVATLMWNHAAHLEAYFGIPLAGGVIHTLNLRLPAEQIAWIIDDAEDRFLIVDEVLLPLFQKCRKPAAEVDAEELRAHLAGSFPKWWLLDGFAFVAEIPKTSAGSF